MPSFDIFLKSARMLNLKIVMILMVTPSPPPVLIPIVKLEIDFENCPIIQFF